MLQMIHMVPPLFKNFGFATNLRSGGVDVA